MGCGREPVPDLDPPIASDGIATTAPAEMRRDWAPPRQFWADDLVRAEDSGGRRSLGSPIRVARQRKPDVDRGIEMIDTAIDTDAATVSFDKLLDDGQADSSAALGQCHVGAWRR